MGRPRKTQSNAPVAKTPAQTGVKVKSRKDSAAAKTFTRSLSSKGYKEFEPGDVADRRREVGRLMALRYSLRAIHKALYESGFVNQGDKGQWGLSTIQRDMADIKAEWRKERLDSVDQYVKEELKSLNELQSVAMETHDYYLALKCMERRAKLLGLDQPVKTDVTSNGEKVDSVHTGPINQVMFVWSDTGDNGGFGGSEDPEPAPAPAPLMIEGTAPELS